MKIICISHGLRNLTKGKVYDGKPIFSYFEKYNDNCIGSLTSIPGEFRTDITPIGYLLYGDDGLSLYNGAGQFITIEEYRQSKLNNILE